ncbi:MAG: hypothetical protein WCY74_03255 [Sphaerochaetaceae bacterium]|jgi:hypothetical protein|nr:hypothetical protein [Sphaerochaetaceae bacterium]MDX9940005.1 hypothetical protein [Sphaerochaetaceae bacterium]
MVTFTSAEREVLDECIRILEEQDSPFVSVVSARVRDLEQLAAIVDRAPSPNVDLLHHSDMRNLGTLAKKLCAHGLGHVVDLPTKAVLGHGLTVSKLHLFGLLMKLLVSVEELDACRPDIEKEYNDLLFTLMAEDLYTALISEQDMQAPWVHEAVHELITMWDLRTSGYLETFALAIRDLWQARHMIVPVLGTLLGTMEIMRLSALLPPVWLDFLSSVSDDEEIGYALEEFLFDLRYEELMTLRSRMALEQIKVIDRQTAWHMLGKRDLPQLERNAALALYKSFMSRQQSAKIRNYRQDAGPKRSLEEYFVIYLLSSENYVSTLKIPE